jgi:hypothetical protein
MQGGNEDGALHREFEGAVLQQIAQDIGDAEPFPYLAEQQQPADGLCRGRKPLDVFVQRVDEKHLISELGSRGKQRGQCAGSGKFVGTAEIGDDGLVHGAVDAFVLDDLNVAPFAGLLETEEHGPLSKGHHEIRFISRYQAHKLGKRGTTFYENAELSSTISIPYKR